MQDGHKREFVFDGELVSTRIGSFEGIIGKSAVSVDQLNCSLRYSVQRSKPKVLRANQYAIGLLNHTAYTQIPWNSIPNQSVRIVTISDRCSLFSVWQMVLDAELFSSAPTIRPDPGNFVQTITYNWNWCRNYRLESGVLEQVTFVLLWLQNKCKQKAIWDQSMVWVHKCEEWPAIIDWPVPWVADDSVINLSTKLWRGRKIPNEPISSFMTKFIVCQEQFVIRPNMNEMVSAVCSIGWTENRPPICRSSSIRYPSEALRPTATTTTSVWRTLRSNRDKHH